MFDRPRSLSRSPEFEDELNPLTSESETESESDQTKPAERIATRALPSCSRSFVGLELSPVGEKDFLNGELDRERSQQPLSRDIEEAMRQSISESESERDSEQQKPVARIATRLPPGYSRSFSEPELSPVAETDASERGESDQMSSSFSTGGSVDSNVDPSVFSSGTLMGLVGRDFLKRLLGRTSGKGTPDVTSSLFARGCPSAAVGGSDGRGASDYHSSESTATATSTPPGATSMQGGSSPGTLTLPVQPLLRGGPALSDCSSRLTGSQSRWGSFVSSRGASLSSLNSSFSDEDDSRHSSRSSVCSGVSQGRDQLVAARRKSFPSISSLVSKERLEEERRDSDSTNTGRSLCRTRNALSASFVNGSPAVDNEPTTPDRQHELQQDRPPSPSSPPVLLAIRSHHDAALDSVAGGTGDGSDDGDTQISAADERPGAGGLWAVDSLSDMSGRTCAGSQTSSITSPEVTSALFL